MAMILLRAMLHEYELRATLTDSVEPTVKQRQGNALPRVRTNNLALYAVWEELAETNRFTTDVIRKWKKWDYAHTKNSRVLRWLNY